MIPKSETPSMNRRERRAAAKKAGITSTSSRVSTPNSLHEAGRRHLRAGQFEEAEECCHQALAMDGSHADSLYLAGSRAIPPPRILTDEELGSLMSACRRVSPGYPERSAVLTVFVGLLASTGLRSGEARRLDRADVDLVDGVLHIRKTKFRKYAAPMAICV